MITKRNIKMNSLGKNSPCSSRGKIGILVIGSSGKTTSEMDEIFPVPERDILKIKSEGRKFLFLSFFYDLKKF